MAVRTSTGFAEAILGANSFDQIFLNGCMEIRTGGQPASGDHPVTGTLIARITRDGGAWVAGSPANGLQFSRSGRYAAKNPSHLWRLQGSGTGTAGWVRLLANPFDDGLLNYSAPRIDGLCGLEGGGGDIQLFLSTVSIVPATVIDIGQWWYALPPLGA